MYAVVYFNSSNDMGVKKMKDLVQCCKACNKKAKDALVYGTGITKHGTRKWYNPLRYIKGRIYTKHIKLEDVFK